MKAHTAPNTNTSTTGYNKKKSSAIRAIARNNINKPMKSQSSKKDGEREHRKGESTGGVYLSEGVQATYLEDRP